MNKKNYYKFALNMNLANIIAIVEFIIIAIFNYIFNWIDLENLSYVLIFALIIFYTILHEFLHGIAFSLNTKDKKSIKYGVLLEKGVCYAACQSGIGKKGIIVSLLFPTIFLTIIPLPLAIYYHLEILTLCALYNFIGAIGDLMMTIFIIRLPKNIEYIDYDITVGATFLSTTDLSHYSSKSMKLIDSGEHKKDNIDNSVKRIYTSKPSIIILGVLCVIVGISFIFSMI